MTYDEILQYINSLSGNQVTADQFEVNPNDPQMQQPNYFKRNSIAWGNVPGMEQYYSYDSANNQENFDIANGLPALEQQGYKWMDAYDPAKNTMANWIVGPDGQPIPESMRSQGGSDERFKLAALAAMGVTGAAAGGLLGGAGAAAPTAGTAAGGAAPLNMAMIESGLGTAGYGYNAGAAASGLFNPATIGSGAGLMFGAGGEIVPYSADLVSQMTAMDSVVPPPGAPPGTQPPVKPPVSPGGPDLPNPGRLLDLALPVAGAIAGSQPSEGETITRQSRMDPRMDPYVFDSYLPGLKAQYEKGKTPNANQQKGWDMQLGLLTDPARIKQMQDMQAAALGKYNSPVAGNPFANGGASLYQSRRGLLGG